jgi:serine/threonine protein kinase
VTGTAQGTIVGTLQYMAPEQVQGAPADARTDIFALGSILHEMAQGATRYSAWPGTDVPLAGPDDEDDETDEPDDQRDDTARDDDGHRSTVEEPTPNRVDMPFQRAPTKKGGARNPDRRPYAFLCFER